MINGQGQSDGEIVPEKFPNNPQGAEGMEGRSPVKGNVQEHPSHRTQSRKEEMQSMLERIRKAVIRTNAYASLPKTRAECGKPARSDP
jgi:predicted metal-dependent peptidase